MSRTEAWIATRDGRPGFHVFVDQLVDRAAGRGELGAEIDPAEVAEVMGAVVRQTLLGWARDRSGPGPPDETLHRRLTLVLDGARHAPGRSSGAARG